MSARKTPSKNPENGHAFAVVVEEIRGQFRIFGEALAGLGEEMSRRFDDVESDIGLLKADVGMLRTDVGLLKTDVGLLKTAVVEHSRQLNGIGAKLKADLDEPGPRSV